MTGPGDDTPDVLDRHGDRYREIEPGCWVDVPSARPDPDWSYRRDELELLLGPLREIPRGTPW